MTDSCIYTYIMQSVNYIDENSTRELQLVLVLRGQTTTGHHRLQYKHPHYTPAVANTL